MPWWVYLIIAGGVVAIALIVIGIRYALRKEAARVQALEEAAILHSWSHSAKGDRLDLVPKEAGTGGGRKTRNIIEDDDFVLFGYQFTTSTGNSAQTHHRRILRIEAPGHQLNIRRRRIRRTKTPTGDPELDRRWVIEGPLAPGMKDMILAEKYRSWQWEGNALTVVEAGVLHAHDVPRMVDEARAFMALVS